MQIRLKEHTMIEWFDDLALGMRFKSGNVQITESDIKRFAAESQSFLADPHQPRAPPVPGSQSNLVACRSGVDISEMERCLPSIATVATGSCASLRDDS